MARYKINQTTGELTLLDEVGENAVCWDDVEGSAPSIQDPYLKQSDVDDSLSSLSENPVQNKVMKAAVDEIKGRFDYSTTEKVVGTWIDSKPIYQKTFYIDGSSCVAGFNYTGVTVPNFKRIVSWNGYMINGNACLLLPYENNVNNANATMGFFVLTDSKEIVIVLGTNFSALSECYLTLRYTKTTD